uniref:SCP domain-containing protein n=1 Tax=Meloidogyne incognita TaxID=6306 RepID=A0A914LX77_MELIC
MQICTDVKYENRRRPKFAAVVDANFQRQCLQAHNHVRQIYGIPPLLWSQELAELAKNMGAQIDTTRSSSIFQSCPELAK